MRIVGEGLIVEWQPIESAPKDGTEILVANISNGAIYTVMWLDEGESIGWWDIASLDDYGRATLFSPTHWMQLPNPPVQS